VDEKTGRVLGMAASLVIRGDDCDITGSWRDFTDHGMFTNHDPESGRTLYGAEIMARPSAQRRGVGSKSAADARGSTRMRNSWSVCLQSAILTWIAVISNRRT